MTDSVSAVHDVTVMSLNGNIPKAVNNSFVLPTIMNTEINHQRFFSYVRGAADFSESDSTELGKLLAVKLIKVRRNPAELRRVTAEDIERTTVLRVCCKAYPWVSEVLYRIVRNKLRRPGSCKTSLADFGVEDAAVVGGSLSVSLLTHVDAAGAVLDWSSAYPVIGELEER